MSKPRRSGKPNAANPEALAAEVHATLRAHGMLVPRDEGAVRRAEAEPPPPLPAELQDPDAAFARGAEASGLAARVAPFAGDAAVDATLARAARECGRLTPEIEAAMRRDREAAEREMDDEEPQ